MVGEGSVVLSLRDRSAFIFAAVCGLTTGLLLIQTLMLRWGFVVFIHVFQLLVVARARRGCGGGIGGDEDEDAGVLPAAAAGLQHGHGPRARQ